VNTLERQRLVALATEHAQDHPAEVERALRRGMRRYRLRVLSTYVVVIAVIAVVTGGVSVARATLAGPHPSAAGGPHSVASITTIAITPAESTVAPDESRQLAVDGTYSDGSTQDVTALVDWASGDPEIATVDDTGLVTATGQGTTTVTATLNDQTDTATVTVTTAAPTLTAIAITPAESMVCLGGTQRLKAEGTYSDGSTQDVTPKVDWASDNPKVATVDDTGLVTATGQGTTTVTATLNDQTDTATVTVELCEG
jgi:trimeric autotransporter adhesin